MERKLIEAAKNGDVGMLHRLINEHPFALALANGGETPLHMACMGGHVDFVKVVLGLGAEFGQELNQDGLSPLHIASSRGDIEIVKELLKVGSHLCLVKGREKRIPLHCAVSKGRTEVITELLLACQDSITQVTARGETCFHLAVKNTQFEPFKILCEYVVSLQNEDILNHKDQQGNTILHLASSRKQYEVFDLLLDNSFSYKDKLEVNYLNKRGLTPLDCIISQGGDCEIEEMLTLAGATRGAEPSQNLVIAIEDPPNEQGRSRDRPKSATKKLQDYFKYDKIRESPSKARNTLLVIAVLIVTATYQAVLSPPGGVWQDDHWPPDAAKNSTAKQPPRHTAGQSVMGTNNSVAYSLFLFFNSIGFFMSLHMMNFLTHGLPLHFEIRVALFALTATYDTCMIGISPPGLVSVLFIVLSIVMPGVMPQYSADQNTE
ncbi:hypothetical protein ACS0TY_000612 [Phlomoides rotata]